MSMQAGAASSHDREALVDLVGKDPLWGSLAFLAGYVAVLLACWMSFAGSHFSGWSVGLFFLALVATPIQALRVFLAFAAAHPVVTAARKAVRQGEITPTWVGRIDFCVGGILVVDEGARRIHLCGETFPFEFVKGVQCLGTSLQIVRSQGEKPIVEMKLPASLVPTMAHRLANSIGGLTVTEVHQVPAGRR